MKGKIFKMRPKLKKTSRVTKIIINHIKDNLKSYIVVSLILLIGIILGVFFVNNMNTAQAEELKSYINDFINALKQGYTINNMELLKKSMGNNLLFTFLMWFIGSTVVGIPIVLGIVAFRGFCLGYTISAVIAILGSEKGLLFFISSILLQNLIFIPCMLALSVSGIKLYKSIMKDKRKENIKIEIFRHTAFSLLMLALLLLSSLIETYVSTNLLLMCIQWF